MALPHWATGFRHGLGGVIWWLSLVCLHFCVHSSTLSSHASRGGSYLISGLGSSVYLCVSKHLCVHILFAHSFRKRLSFSLFLSLSLIALQPRVPSGGGWRERPGMSALLPLSTTSTPHGASPLLVSFGFIPPLSFSSSLYLWLFLMARLVFVEWQRDGLPKPHVKVPLGTRIFFVALGCMEPERSFNHIFSADNDMFVLLSQYGGCSSLRVWLLKNKAVHFVAIECLRWAGASCAASGKKSMHSNGFISEPDMFYTTRFALLQNAAQIDFSGFFFLSKQENESVIMTIYFNTLFCGAICFFHYTS